MLIAIADMRSQGQYERKNRNANICVFFSAPIDEIAILKQNLETSSLSHKPLSTT